MNVIHMLVNSFWTNGMSGGDRRVIELLRRFELIDDLRIIVYGPKSFQVVLRNEGIKHIRFEITDKGISKRAGIIYTYYRRTSNLIEILRTNIRNDRREILYSSSDIMPDVIPAVYIKKKMPDTRWVLITHHINEFFLFRPGNVLINLISCSQQQFGIFCGKRWSDRYLVVSPVAYDAFIKSDLKQDKIIRVDNAVDVDLINSASKECISYDGCFLGRLSPSKGVFELPYIWKKVTKARPNAKLAVMGRGSEQDTIKLKEIIKQLGLIKSIDLLGYTDSEEAYSIIKKSEVFIFPSHEEGWGIAVAEALACGTPVVTYNLPVFSRLFDKGILVGRLKDIDGTANNVIKLLNDDYMRERMGQDGKEYVITHYSWDAIADKEVKAIMNI